MNDMRKRNGPMRAAVTGATLIVCGIGGMGMSDDGAPAALGRFGAWLCLAGAMILTAGALVALARMAGETRRRAVLTGLKTREAWQTIKPLLDKPIDPCTGEWLAMIVTDARAQRLIDADDARIADLLDDGQWPLLEPGQQHDLTDIVDRVLDGYTVNHVRFGIARAIIPPIRLSERIIDGVETSTQEIPAIDDNDNERSNR